MKGAPPLFSARFAPNVQNQINEIDKAYQKAYKKAYRKGEKYKAYQKAYLKAYQNSIFLNEPHVWRSISRIRSPDQRIEFINQIMEDEIANLRCKP